MVTADPSHLYGKSAYPPLLAFLVGLACLLISVSLMVIRKKRHKPSGWADAAIPSGFIVGLIVWFLWIYRATGH